MTGSGHRPHPISLTRPPTSRPSNIRVPRQEHCANSMMDTMLGSATCEASALKDSRSAAGRYVTTRVRGRADGEADPLHPRGGHPPRCRDLPASRPLPIESESRLPVSAGGAWSSPPIVRQFGATVLAGPISGFPCRGANPTTSPRPPERVSTMHDTGVSCMPGQINVHNRPQTQVEAPSMYEMEGASGVPWLRRSDCSVRRVRGTNHRRLA